MVCSYDIHVRCFINLLILHYKIHNHPCVLKHATYPATWPLQPPRHMNTWPLVEHSPTYLPTHTPHIRIYTCHRTSYRLDHTPGLRSPFTHHHPPSPTATHCHLLPTYHHHQKAASRIVSVQRVQQSFKFVQEIGAYQYLSAISVYHPYQYIRLLVHHLVLVCPPH